MSAEDLAGPAASQFSLNGSTDVVHSAEVRPKMESQPALRPVYAWVVVVLSAAAYILSNVDRQLIAILIVPIQRDLGLSDTQFGALQGVAYGLFYAGLCIPIAGLSDRFSRSAVISLGLAVWSAATAACGLVRGFGQLFVARAVVGMGEASLLPAVYSLVADLFPRNKVGRAMGVFFLAPFLGSTVAFLVGGTVFHWLGESGRYGLLGFELHSWQLTFLIAAAPGLLLAAIIALVVRDPRRPSEAVAKVVQPPFSEVLRYIRERREVFTPFLAGMPLTSMPLYATLAWGAAYLIRTEGLSSAQAGVWLGSALLLAGCGGALIAGLLTDFLISRKRGAAPFEVCIGAAVPLALSMAVVLLVPMNGAAYFVLAVAAFFGSSSLAPSAAIVQAIAPPQLRSRVSAIFLVINLLSNTCATFLIGLLNDRVFGGPQGIRICLPLFIGASALVASLLLIRGRKTLAAYTARVAATGVY